MKKFNYLLLTILVSLLPMLIILVNPGLIHTHDGLVHLPRIAAWFKALKDGQIPPRWAGEINYGYGTPILNFMYPWPYFLASAFLFFRLGLVWSFKLSLTLSFIASGFFMFIFARNFLKDVKQALLVCFLYQFAPFHLVDVIWRGAIGEAWTYAFIPLALLGLWKIFSGVKKRGIVLTAVAVDLLILSHNSVSLSFFGVLCFFILFFGKKFPDYLLGALSLFWGLCLAAFYWLPALWEKKFTYGDLFMKNLYLDYFPTLKQLFWPNFLNKPWGQVGHVAVQIGFFQLAALIMALILLINNKLRAKEKKTIIFCLAVFGLSLFLILPISIPLWKNIALLRQFQFSWRMLSLVTLTTAITGFAILGLPKVKKFYWLLAILIVASSISFWLPQEGFDKIDESYYWNFPLNTTYFGEADVIWSAGPATEYPKERYSVISGRGLIKEQIRKSNLHRLQVSAQTPVSIVDRTPFFPGWRVFVDGKNTPVQFQDANQRGLIVFEVPKGEHQVEIKFGRTKDRIIAETITLISLVVLAVYLLKLKAWRKSFFR